MSPEERQQMLAVAEHIIVDLANGAEAAGDYEALDKLEAVLPIITRHINS